MFIWFVSFKNNVFDLNAIIDYLCHSYLYFESNSIINISTNKERSEYKHYNKVLVYITFFFKIDMCFI